VIDWLVVLNAALLLACAAIYFGTGVSLQFFSLPSAPEMTPDNYYDQIVPQLTRATRFLTVLTNVMFASGVLMVWSEWGTWYVSMPIVTLALVVLATWITVKRIFPFNDRLKTHITDPAELVEVLHHWVRLSWIRSAVWAGEFAVVAAWFVVKAR
jgi:hypothetical protein